MSEPQVFEELGGEHFLVREQGPTPAQRIEHAKLEYEQQMEKLNNEDLRQVELAAKGVMSDQKRTILLNILDQLQERVQEADEEFEKKVPGGAAQSRERKELMSVLNLLRQRLLKTRIDLTIAHATEHAPALAHAVLASATVDDRDEILAKLEQVIQGGNIKQQEGQWALHELDVLVKRYQEGKKGAPVANQKSQEEKQEEIHRLLEDAFSSS
jgi:hypothetical protein